MVLHKKGGQMKRARTVSQTGKVLQRRPANLLDQSQPLKVFEKLRFQRVVTLWLVVRVVVLVLHKVPGCGAGI